MTRDQVAAMALQGMLAGRPRDMRLSQARYALTAEAVAIADALLAELARTAPKPEPKKTK